MPLLDRDRSTLAIIDFQSSIMPVIHECGPMLENARRLVAAAEMLEVPMVTTEQNPDRLGATVSEVGRHGTLVAKMSFGSCDAPEFMMAIGDESNILVMGVEAHVCVQQTVLGLLAKGRSVTVVRDAVGSRRSESKETAITRMAGHGAEIVTTEMVIFEWLRTADHPQFRPVSKLIR
ncbi:nicotinamidase-related amidase [Rhodoligotrophos appendicifer]|uniref:isochorismatase family protein n=1 Tax=Rhodoligotrophos appendicifer TaxID=987056 RepID=UPI0011859E42|nr:isochorismatase family protein [Rhodoligotrophos appendicifer]